MEWDGTEIDFQMREDAKIATELQIKDKQETLDSLVGYKLNVKSHQQIAKFLYYERRYQPKLNKDTKKPTVDKHALNYFAIQKEDPAVRLILEVGKLRDFYSDVLCQKLDENNKIHTHWKIGGTNGARWSSSRSILGSGTNLQNQPRKGLARKLFIAT